MRLTGTALCLLLLLGSAAAADETLESLAALMAGTYQSTSPPFVDRRVRVAAPELGQVVFYLELLQGDPLEVYRQRLLVFERDERGRILQRAFLIADPDRLAMRTESEIRTSDFRDVTPMLGEGCETIWSQTESGFRGYTNPATCVITSSRTGNLRHIEAETVIAKDSMTLIERGYDPAGNQLFGTPQGSRLTLVRTAAD